MIGVPDSRDRTIHTHHPQRLTHPMPVAQKMGAHVEIVEPYSERLAANTTGAPPVLGDLPCIKPTHVRINGVDVGLVKRGSVIIHPGGELDPNGEAQSASVTLTLLVRSVEIKAE